MITSPFKKQFFFTILLFCLTMSLTAQAGLTGDVNSDGTVNIVDALMTAQYYVGLAPMGFNAAVADVNDDGNVSIIDALIIAQYYVGLISIFPGNANTTPVPATPSPMAIQMTPIPAPAATGTPPPGGTTVILPPTGVTPVPVNPSASPDPSLNYFYFSYDDSASTAAVDLVKYQVNNDFQVDPGLARPWEFLNYEEFNPVATENIGLFDVSMGVWERPAMDPEYITDYKLGISITSPTVNKATRKNIVITLIIDISGSMGSTTLRVDDMLTTRMDITKYGLNRMAQSLKAGDVINVITFDTTARIVQQGLTYENDLARYLSTVDAMAPRGSTNLNDGINKGYQAALATFDPSKTNRVVILTDAYANTGTVDPTLISENIVINNQEGIYFSGLGISADFNEVYLNKLVEAGKGAFFTLVTMNDAARAFEERFFALLTVAAKDVQFRLDFPPGLIRDVTASEETSTDPVDVKPTNFSFNTSQFFFEGFKTDTEISFTDQSFKLTVTYRDPDNGNLLSEIYEKPVIEVLGVDEELIRDAEVIFLFTELFGQKKTAPEINKILTTYYAAYWSPLFNEYLNLIQTYIGSEFVVSPQSIYFGTATVGERLIRQVTVSNNTLDTITITDVLLDNFTTNNSAFPPTNIFEHGATVPVLLEPGDSYKFNVIFNADREGTFTANLLILTTQSQGEVSQISLRGTASYNPITPTPIPTIIPVP